MAVSGNPQLLARPPTPPKAKDVESAIDEAIRALDTSFGLAPNSLLVTPPSSSPIHKQDHDLPTPLRSETRKIRFNTEPQRIPDAPSDLTEVAPSSILKLIPSSKLQSSSKSILKPFEPFEVSEATDDSTGRSPHKLPSFAAMLEYATRQLASTASGARMDGYRLLTDSLQAYDDMPDADQFRGKLQLLEQFIRRDISATSHISSAMGTRLALPALKLAYVLFSTHAKTCRFMSNDFLEWLADDLLRIVEESSAPKEILKNHLLLMSTNVLSDRTCTLDRVTRILKALLSIHQKVSGLAILNVRLLVYARLIDRQPQAMSACIRQWLPQILHGTLSSNRDLQARAVEAGLRAADVFGKMPLAAHALNGFFDQASADSPDQTNFDKFESGVHSILDQGTPECKLDVPRIWSVVILLLRSSKRELQYWPRIPRWMAIIQRCFNKSNHDLAIRAFNAWNRFIIAVKPSLDTRPTISRTLCQLIVSHLVRPASTDKARQIRNAALSSYCLFLYYAFRPTASEEQLGRYWKACIVDLLDSASDKNLTEAPALCKILSTILCESTMNVWNEERTRNSIARPLRPEELPRLSSQWTRTNVSAVLPVIARLFDLTSKSTRYNMSGPLRVWNCLLQTLAQAGEKEILPSRESRNASEDVAQVLCNVMGRLETHCLHSAGCTSSVTRDMWNLASSTIAILGPAPFLKIAEATEVVSPATLQASSERHVPVGSNIKRIFKTAARSLGLCDSDISISVNELWSPCLKSLQSRSARLRLLKVFATELSDLPALAEPTFGCIQLWTELMTSLHTCLEGEVRYQDLTHDLRDEYNEVLYIIDTGLRVNSQVVEEYIGRALDDLVRVLRKDAGRDRLILGLWWPLLRRAVASGRSWSDSARMKVAALLLSSFHPLDRQTSEDAKRVLCKVTGFAINLQYEQEWFHLLCTLASGTLADVYNKGEPLDELNTGLFLRAMGYFAKSESNIHPQRFLCEIKDGLALWVEDKASVIASAGTASEFLVLWRDLLGLFNRMSKPDDEDVSEFAELYRAGFQSRRKDVAMATIDAWGVLPSSQSLVKIFKHLQPLLAVLQEISTIKYPLEGTAEQSEISQQTSPDYGALFPWFRKSEDPWSRSQPEPSIPQVLSNSKRPARTVFARNRPLGDPSKPSARTTPAKLRHDDSQMQFIPIQSSSPQHTTYDSQMLTEHQKEVTRRQEGARALYEDLATSSPAPYKSRKGDESQPIKDSWNDGVDDNLAGRSNLGNVACDALQQNLPSSPIDGRNDSSHLDAASIEASIFLVAEPSTLHDAGDLEKARPQDEDQEREREQRPLASPALPSLRHELTCSDGAELPPSDVKPPVNDAFVDDLAIQGSDPMPCLGRPTSPIQVPTSQGEIADEGEEIVAQQKEPFLGVSSRNSGRIEESFVGQVMSDTADNEQAAEAASSAPRRSSADHAEPLLSQAQIDGSHASKEAGPATVPGNMVSALPRSPSHTTPHVRIPAAKQPQASVQQAQTDGTTITPVDDSPSQVSVKRKRDSRAATVPRKKTRVSGDKAISHRSLTTGAEGPEDPVEDAIVLGKGGPNTPSFYQVIREREASQSQKASPTAKRSGRKSSTGGTSKSSLRKRSLDDYTGNEVDVSSNQGTPYSLGSQAKRLRPSRSMPKRAMATRNSEKPSRSGSGTRPETSTPSQESDKKGTSSLIIAQRNPRRSTKASPTARQSPKEPRKENGANHVEVRSSDFATSDDKHPTPVRDSTSALDGDTEPATPPSGASSGSMNSTPNSAMSQGTRIRSFREKLQGLWTDAKRLVLGGPEHEAERRDLEDMSFAFSREVVLAGRRSTADST